MAVQKTKAIVIGFYALGEADRIMVFYTRDFGVMRAVAKGARKAKSKLCGRLELFTYGDLVFYERKNKDLHIINSFDMIETFQILREDLLKFAYCSYLGELVQQIEFPEAPNPEIFDLFLKIISLMKNMDDPELLVRIFEIRIFTNAGFEPHLDSCVACSGEIHGTKLEFSIAKGGVLCDKCADQNILQQLPSISISLGTLELIKRMQRNSLELMLKVKMLESNRREIRQLFRNFISFHLDGKHFRSLDFLASIEKDLEANA